MTETSSTDDEKEMEKETKNQPEPEGRLRRIANHPLIKNTPLGSGNYIPSVDLIEVSQSYRGEYAVERDDGALLGAIRVNPANMATTDEAQWRKQVDSLARVLAADISYPCQWFNAMKTVDYSSRQSRYAGVVDRIRRKDRHSEATFGEQVLGDIALERMDNIGYLEETTMEREYYVIVAVEPDEAVATIDDDSGILSVPGIGSIVKQKRLYEQQGSPEHVRDLLDILQSRVNELARSLRGVEGISTHPLSSAAFSRVLADYYRGEDVYSYADFTDLIRGSPVPGLDDAAENPDPVYDVSFYSLSDVDKALATAGGGESTPAPVKTAALADGGVSIPYVVADPADRYPALLAPDSIDSSDANAISIDVDWHSMTLAIRDWPDRPPLGMLEDILNYDQPGVRVTVSTHFNGLDVSEERRKLKSTTDSLERKAIHAEKNKSPFEEKRWREFKAARDVKEAVEDANEGLFATNTYIEIRSRHEDSLDEAARQIRSRLKELNANAKPLTRNHTKGWQTVAPVCRDEALNSVKMTGQGLAALIPWTSHNLIEAGGIEVGTHADRCEPTVIDIWSRDTGYNVGIFGDIGSGKTTTLKEILLRQKLTTPDLNIVMIDPLQEFAGLCELFEGDRVVIGGETPINPLHLAETPADKLEEIGTSTPFKDAKRRALTFIETYYEIENIDLGEKRGVWDRSISEAYREAGITIDPSTHANDSPTLRDVIDIIEDMVTNPADYVRSAVQDDDEVISERKTKAIDILNNDIEAFGDGGVYHHLTQTTDQDMLSADVLYLDLQRYEGEAKTGLMMQLLVNEVYEQAKASDNPTIMAMDESHYMLKNSTDLAFLKQAVRHSRHYDLSLMFSTQTVSEFFAASETGGEELTGDAKVIIDNMSTKVFHFLSEMNASWAEEFGLSRNEMEYIQNASPGNESLGYSDALLNVDQEGCYPIKVEMHADLNPREFAALDYDPSKHGNDLREYLTDRSDHWTWMP